MEVASLWVVMIAAMLGILFAVFIVWVVFMARAYYLETEVKMLIEEYKGKCNGSNRFLLNESLLRQLYPEYGDPVIRMVWRRLVMTKAIERDNLDNEWCIRK